MSEMTDRIANGILLCFNNMSGSKEEVARCAAILAIQLMREPTDEMWDAGEQYCDEWSWSPNYVWKAMIDAALARS